MGGGASFGSIPATGASASPTVGAWAYLAGVAGARDVPALGRVLQITAIALEAGGTLQINGGDIITIPYGGTDRVSSAIDIAPLGNLVAPHLVFTGTDAYFVEYVT